jgi:hypothetical protein
MGLFRQPNKVQATNSKQQSYSIDQRIALTPTNSNIEEPKQTFVQENPQPQPKEEEDMEYDF